MENRRWLWFDFASGVLWSIQVVKTLEKHETLEPMVTIYESVLQALYRLAECKESQFYSLHFGQVVPSMQ